MGNAVPSYRVIGGASWTKKSVQRCARNNTGWWTNQEVRDMHAEVVEVHFSLNAFLDKRPQVLQSRLHPGRGNGDVESSQEGRTLKTEMQTHL